MRFMETADVPPEATELFNKHETFRTYVANLNLTVTWYNHVRQSLHDVEFPLVQSQLTSIDAVLNQAETTLSWNSDGSYNMLII